jgi:arsenate reductase (thioredoxin)
VKKNIAFICMANTSRSQMAEAFAKKHGKGCMTIYSAGIRPGYSVNENVIIVMEEKGFKMDSQFPKKLSDIPDKVDVLVIMGPDVGKPGIESGMAEEWNLQDPSGKELDFFRKTRDVIEHKVIELLNKLERKEETCI